MIEKNLIKRIITSFVLISILFSMYISSMMMILAAIVISALSFYEFNRLIVRILKNTFLKFLSSGVILLYLFLFVFIIFWIESVKVENPNYKLFFFYAIFVSIGSDLGGYIFGNIFKGKKLTKISPNKTISGSIGSIIFSIATGLGLIYYFTKNFDLIIVLVAIATSIFCQIGDLLFSILKRKSLLKDTGNFLPGHGGILDRVDGILIGVPMGFLTLIIIN